jgi:hypothetical protein
VQFVTEGVEVMSLLNDLGIDIATVNASKTEQSVESGGRVAEGKHHAALVGARSGQTENGSKYRELTFKILAGPSAGMELKDKVFLPNANQKEDSRKTVQNRVMLFMHRLGVLSKTGDNYVPIPGRDDFQDVVDKVDCVIVVKHEQRDYEKDGKTRSGTFAILDFEGVLLKDDKRCATVPKGKFEASATASVTASVPASSKSDERKKKYANV